MQNSVNSIRILMSDLEKIYEKIGETMNELADASIIIQEESCGIGQSYSVKIITSPPGQLAEGRFFTYANYDNW